MKVIFGIAAALIAITVIFIGYKIWMIDTALSSNIEAQTPHLEILSKDPIIADSLFKVSAFASADGEANPVPIINIIRQSDGAYQGGKALKITFQTEVSMLAPRESGAYLLQLGDMKREFMVYPIVAELSLSQRAYQDGDVISVMLNTNANGNQTLTLETHTGLMVETIRNGWDQNFSEKHVNFSAPLEAGFYNLIYRKSLGAEIARISFQVTLQE